MRTNKSIPPLGALTIGTILTVLAATTIAAEVAIQCTVNITIAKGLLGIDRFSDSLRIDIIEEPEYLSIFGEGKDFELKISTRRNIQTRLVENNSNKNEWKISRADEMGEAISTKRIVIDRNTGNIIYEESLYRVDGKMRPFETSLTGECRAIDINRRRF
jgi:hypothetical protein